MVWLAIIGLFIWLVTTNERLSRVGQILDNVKERGEVNHKDLRYQLSEITELENRIKKLENKAKKG